VPSPPTKIIAFTELSFFFLKLSLIILLHSHWTGNLIRLPFNIFQVKVKAGKVYQQQKELTVFYEQVARRLW